jgi:hypothetical protein
MVEHDLQSRARHNVRRAMNVSLLLLVLSPIYLKPGQCLVVGSQEVCAMQSDATAPTAPVAKATVVHTCRYGDLENPDVKDAKGWSHIMITLKEDGSKVETIVKSYGPLDEHKKECEVEARRVESRSK